MRKILYLLLVLFCLGECLYAQAPQAFSFQAVARNKSGEVMKKQLLELQISILADNANGSVIYRETHTATTSDAGVLSLQIGKGQSLQGEFAKIDWASGKAFFLHTELTINNEKVDLGTSQILSVPYALYAARSGEKHDLVLEGRKLSIKGGGASVTLPASTTGGSCLWEDGLTDIYHEGSISLRQKNIPYLEANADIDGIGHLRLNYKGDKSITFDQGEIVTYNAGEQPKVKIVNTANSENGGIGIYGAGYERLSLLVPQIEGGTGSMIDMKGKKTDKSLINLSATDYGSISLFSAFGSNDGFAYLSSGALSFFQNNKQTSFIGLYGNPDIQRGIIHLYDVTNSDGKSSVYIGGDGSIGLFGSNGKKNVSLGSVDNYPNSGGVWICDEEGNYLVKISSVVGSEAMDGGISICSHGEELGKFQVINGKSRLTTDELYLNGSQLRTSTTNYTKSNLRSSSSSYAPCFVSESTDWQITFRGTATLSNGRFKVILPAEEAAKIEDGSMTVQVTPLSIDSKGLAVVRKEKDAFTVAELMSGTGSYAFDWTLTALRREEPQLRSDEIYGTADAAPLKMSETPAPIPLPTTITSK